MKIAFTGHRPNKFDNDYDLKSKKIKWIEWRIVSAYETIKQTHQVECFIVGMALGIDTLCAKLAIKLKIPFIAAIPFKGQAMRWPKQSQMLYGELIGKADKIFLVDKGIYVTYNEYLRIEFSSLSPSLASQAMNNRNKWMVDECQILISVWDNSPGGTANCTNYAASKKKNIIYVDPNDFYAI